MFALLEHETTRIDGAADNPRDVHWDLLIEVAGQELLPTWRLSLNPLICRTNVPAQRIKDHRRRYLDFEGALSEGRGFVRRLDRGAATVTRLDQDEVVAELRGESLRGRLVIERPPGRGLVLSISNGQSMTP